MSAQRFNVLCVDPPWAYRDTCDAGERGAEHKYPALGVADLCLLDVPSIAADDAVLFMWATPPTLLDAFAVMKAWGFEYKTFAFTWVKTTKTGSHAWGMGHWTRANAEPVLLGVRGDFDAESAIVDGTEVVLLGRRGRPKRASAAVHQVVVAERGRHSAKPPEVRDRIVQLMGDVPRIELFARDRAPGWAAWGNEVPGGSDVELGFRGQVGLFGGRAA